MLDFDDSMKRANVERSEDWRGLVNDMPFISFPAHWQVKIIPPFAGAVARFVVKAGNGDGISVYFDVFEALGCVDQPYWEIYPNVYDECERFLADETDQMVAAIEKSRLAIEAQS